MAIDWLVAGGFLCGVLAGGAARWGRLCTMGAIEDALVGHDYRGAKAWGLAIATAIVATQTLWWIGLADIEHSLYLGSGRLHWLGTALGGVLFGLGMTLAGTCSFGLLVRTGGGDLRAAMTALIVGILAVAATAGALAPLREPLLGIGIIAFAPGSSTSLVTIIGRALGAWPAWVLVAIGVIALVVPAARDPRLMSRRRLMVGAVLMGLAVAAGWAITTQGVEAFRIERPESLSFVAPVGRGLSQFMMDAFRNAGFGIASAIGVVVASLAVSLWRSEFRWEAFDDAIEMRRHLVGGALMGIGGVLAQGCTIGQGLSGASTLAISAPIFLASLLVGAKIGLMHLIEGRLLWRFGRSRAPQNHPDRA